VRELEDLMREVEQLFVLRVLFLDGLPLLVGDRLTLRVRAVLADHHEGGEEDRLERDDHRQQAVRIALDAEPDPTAEPEHVDVDEPHRTGEKCDPVREAVLDALRPLLRVPDERRVRLELRKTSAVEAGAPFARRASLCVPLDHGRRLLPRFVLRGRHASCFFAMPAWIISTPTHIATSAVTRAGSIVCISLSSS
jgi:hypothetical protein